MFLSSVFPGQNLLKPRPNWSPLGVTKSMSHAQMVSFRGSKFPTSIPVMLTWHVYVYLESYTKIVHWLQFPNQSPICSIWESSPPPLPGSLGPSVLKSWGLFSFSGVLFLLKNFFLTFSLHPKDAVCNKLCVLFVFVHIRCTPVH